MFRLFKHYVPHAVLLLGLVDLILLFVAAELSWVIRAGQIGMAVEPLLTRLVPLLVFAGALQLAMVAVGVYGIEALLSLRFAAARLLVAISLGVILFELVTGELPIMASHPVEMIRKVIDSPPKSPREFVPDVAPALEMMIGRCLRKAPEQRYDSVDEMAAEIELFLKGASAPPAAPAAPPPKAPEPQRSEPTAAPWTPSFLRVASNPS